MTVLLVGPVPPPYQGMSVYTEMLLAEFQTLGVRVHWIDSSDHREMTTMGKLDWGNVYGNGTSQSEWVE